MQPNPEAQPSAAACCACCRPACRRRANLQSTTALAFALGVGTFGMFGMGAMTLGGAALVFGVAMPATAHACAANPCASCDPCAACAANPCAADPCTPCAAMACAACDPCGPCAACDPCAAGCGVATGCHVPRLQEAAANPCAVDACAPCGPCAACDPCAAMDCAACDPCAPCAAMACAACDPCAPCAACGPCGPCGPCAAAAPPPEVSDDELRALYDCMIEAMQAMEAGGATQPILASWTESDRPEAGDFTAWKNFAAVPYISFTHGGRFATNHANAIAAEVYGLYEEIGEMPAGGIVAKPTFSIGADGQGYWETLFLMEKAEAGTSPDTNDWIYTAIMPDGSLMGRTLGPNAQAMQFCADCHIGMSDGTDDLLFMEEEYRLRN